jgi:hypothetical protein
MLRLLLDEHISPVVARELVAKQLEIEVVPLQAWENRAYIGLPDVDILKLATVQGLTLVT